MRGIVRAESGIEEAAYRSLASLPGASGSPGPSSRSVEGIEQTRSRSAALTRQALDLQNNDGIAGLVGVEPDGLGPSFTTAASKEHLVGCSVARLVGARGDAKRGHLCSSSSSCLPVQRMLARG